MLGKVLVVAGAGAAYVWRTRSGQEQYARVRERVRTLPSRGRDATPPTFVDRRPVAALENTTAAPVLLPDATPIEVARAVLAEQPRS